ncbi:hypothetical protein CP061683_0990B, partial [Chlamydia psittaci 06-1683]
SRSSSCIHVIIIIRLSGKHSMIH